MAPVASNDGAIPGSLNDATQQYGAVRERLADSLARKRQIDRALTDLESQIYLYEGSYLATTAASGGNIIRGFDSLLKSGTAGTGSTRAAPAYVPATEDRIFSTSSATYQRSLALKANEATDAKTESDESKAPESLSGHSGYKLKRK